MRMFLTWLGMLSFILNSAVFTYPRYSGIMSHNLSLYKASSEQVIDTNSFDVEFTEPLCFQIQFVCLYLYWIYC